MRWRIRRAKIPADIRGLFELYGKDVVAMALGLGTVAGGGRELPTQALMTVHHNQQAAAEWLREERDREDCHKLVMTIVEILILVFVVVGVGLDAAILARLRP
jgi:hypothetical protein